VKVVLIPGCLALLPEYGSLEDPVAELRFAVLEAVSWLGDDVEIVATEQGRRVAQSALAARTRTAGNDGHRNVLVVANGTACRTEKAPGYLDDRAGYFDAELRGALREPSPEAIVGLSASPLAEELWADVAVMPWLADLLEGTRPIAIDFDDDPFGVQYWVMRWGI
jgi:hypothetical protein